MPAKQAALISDQGQAALPGLGPLAVPLSLTFALFLFLSGFHFPATAAVAAFASASATCLCIFLPANSFAAPGSRLHDKLDVLSSVLAKDANIMLPTVVSVLLSALRCFTTFPPTKVCNMR